MAKRKFKDELLNELLAGRDPQARDPTLRNKMDAQSSAGRRGVRCGLRTSKVKSFPNA